MTRRHIVPFYLPPTACASSCVFCHPTAGRVVDTTRPLTGDQLDREVEAQLLVVGEGQRIELAFYGAPLGADAWPELLERAARWSRLEPVSGIRVAARPDQIDAGALEALRDAGVDCVELDVPSLAELVLEPMGPAHQRALTERAAEQVHAAGLRLGAQVRPGLPSSHPAQERQTLERVVSLRPTFVRICPVLVLKGTWLERLYQQGRYVPLTVDEAASTCRMWLDGLEERGIPVTRIGLQPMRDLQLEPGCVVGGPYHPSLRTLIEAERMHDRAALLLENRLTDGRHLTLHVAPATESNLRGPENCNLTRLQKRFSLATIRVVVDATLPRDVTRAEISTRKAKARQRFAS